MDFWCNMESVGAHFYMKVMCKKGEKIAENQVAGRGQCVLINAKPYEKDGKRTFLGCPQCGLW